MGCVALPALVVKAVAVDAFPVIFVAIPACAGFVMFVYVDKSVAIAVVHPITFDAVILPPITLVNSN